MLFLSPILLSLSQIPILIQVTDDLDSLVNNWYVRLALQNKKFIQGPDSIGIVFPDSVYRDRLASINSIVNLQYNSIIRNQY